VHLFGKLDRYLLLHWPSIWLSRLHLIAALGAVGILVYWAASLEFRPLTDRYEELRRLGYLPGGDTAPNYNELAQEYNNHVTTIATIVILSLIVTVGLTLYWSYLQARDRRKLPFRGPSLWVSYTLQCLLAIAFINGGPLIFGLRSTYISKDIGTTSILVIIVFEVAAATVLSRAVPFWATLVGLGGWLALAILCGVLGSRFEAMRPVLFVQCLFAFMVCASLALIQPSGVPVIALYPVTAFVHVGVPICGLGVLFFGNPSDDTLFKFIASGAAAYLLLSIFLERRLARLRALPR
jgi:hypothetical protein